MLAAFAVAFHSQAKKFELNLSAPRAPFAWTSKGPLGSYVLSGKARR